MEHYLIEFAGLMAVFSVMIISPGADTAMVIRQSLVHGRKAGIYTSFGIGVSLLFHLTYTILGLGLIVSRSLLLFNALKWAGAIYLLVLGYKAWCAPPSQLVVEQTDAARPSALRCFGLGFATNALNPKPVLFFLSLFSALVSPQTPALVQGVYGLGMASALIGWFVVVSNFLTMPNVRSQFVRFGRWLNRITGFVFMGLGVKLALAQSR